MTMYWLSCPQCGWKSSFPVTEEVVKQMTQLTCRNCADAKRPPKEFQVKAARSIIDFFRRTSNGH